MKTKEAIKISIDTAALVCGPYLHDLNDDDLMMRPHPKCNHIKWQLGHLIASDHQMVNGCCPDSMPALPAGFAEQYGKEAAANDDPAAFHSKAELMQLFDAQRAASMEALSNMSAEDLDKESPEEMRGYAPTVASAFGMLGIHWTMHSGQWAVIRRQLGRPPLF